jgi:hypothetical protein
VPREFKDTALLLLIRAHFTSYTQLKNWLDMQQIPHQAENWP